MPSITEPLWRAVRRAGGLGAALRRVTDVLRSEGARGLLRRLQRTVRQEARYEDWIARFDDRPEDDRAAMDALLLALRERPLFSIIMPVFETPAALLEAAVSSVRSQIYPHWELCVCDDGSSSPRIAAFLDSLSREEPRIKWTRLTRNQNISAASNASLTLATGDWIIPLDHDDLLRPHALLEVALAAEANPYARLIYSDEDKIDASGTKRFDAHFKPDWSPDLLRSFNYVSHLAALKREDVLRVGGWTLGMEGAQDHDLYLKVTETLDRRQILHIPKILYHWRVAENSTAGSDAAKPYAVAAMASAIASHLERTGREGDVTLLDDAPVARVRYRLPERAPLATIIIPNKNMAALIRACITSIRSKTTYPHYEILIVDNGSTDYETLRLYDEFKRQGIVIADYPAEFNYSAMNNLGIREARGEVLVFLNNDTSVIGEDWLSELVVNAIRPEVGCVGAKLYFDDDTIQHAGVFVGVCGIACHPYRGFDKGDFGYFGRLRVTQNLSAVTAACLAVKRTIALEVGGFDEIALKIALNDVDFCLKVHAAGYYNVWTPFAELYHFESKTRGYEIGPEKRARFQRESEILNERWQQYVTLDPYYSPHLTRTNEAVTIRTE
ncbi:glycosyltransferase family 2 protein [Bosea lathyri]|uniref:Glycosyltransferase, GT2 family n=1 Tax=Bosea lathyri TaxID=1036778 RepID=A0A1H6D4W9_9HYPH|nr:glycosyltransferase family 2 protein [Bosea lathyri]SEG80350.1 Glycosyltransferase, GT2 family [Bosea lathyri]